MRVIDDLLDTLRRQPDNEMLAYFYFSRTDPQRNSAAAALYSLARQLSTTPQSDALQQPLLELYCKHRARGLAVAQRSLADCVLLLFRFVDAYPQMTLVFDALDECSADADNAGP